jgi:hypothetical protein
LVLVAVIVAPAFADRQAIVEELDNDLVPQDLRVVPAPVWSFPPCSVGNLNAIAFAITNFIAPPEHYSFIFNPAVGCASCPIGVSISSITFPMRTALACTAVVRTHVQDLAKPGEPGYNANCNPPGFEICSSGVFNVTFPGAGIWNVTIPMSCECFGVDRSYALSFDVLSSTCSGGLDLITDATPTACTSWNEFGVGYFDVVTSYNFPGNMSIRAQADCCAPTVSVEEKSWSTVKKIYGEDQ